MGKITKRYLGHFWEKVINMFSKSENRYFMHNALSIFKKENIKKFPFDENLQVKKTDIGSIIWLKRVKTFI